MDGDKYYPRVLLVNAEPISRRHATGITMGNLFRGWPKDRIAQIYYDDSKPDSNICDRSWHLDFYDLRMPFWLREKVIALLGQRKEITGNQGRAIAVESVRRKSSYRDYAFQTLKKVFFRGLEFSSYRVSPDMDIWVREFRPEVIYSTLGTLHLLKLARNLSVNLMIPVVPHFMDDWLVSLHAKGLLDKYLKYQLLRITQHIIDDTPVMMAISEALAEEYQKRYKRVFLPFMNCIDFDVFDNVKRQIYDREEFRFVYTGSLHLGRWEMLLDIGQALSTLESSGINGVLEIYTQHLSEIFLARSSGINTIRFIGGLPPEKVNSLLSKCDGLVHVESFEENTKEYTRYSVSTKLPEYFASGTALFAYGPEEIASIRYVSENELGFVVDSRDQGQLISKLRVFMLDKDLRTKMGTQARKFAEERHNACTQSELFRAALESGCKKLGFVSKHLG